MSPAIYGHPYLYPYGLTCVENKNPADSAQRLEAVMIEHGIGKPLISLILHPSFPSIPTPRKPPYPSYPLSLLAPRSSYPLSHRPGIGWPVVYEVGCLGDTLYS